MTCDFLHDPSAGVDINEMKNGQPEERDLGRNHKRQVMSACKSCVKRVTHRRKRSAPGAPETVKDIEFLLESYAALVDEMDAELQYHIAHVENLKDVVGMQIDHNRNRIITLNLKISAASLAAGTGAALGGLWGMNLQNGYEDVSAWVLAPPDLALVHLFWSTPLHLPCFATTVGAIGILSGGVLLACYQSWWRMPIRAAARIEDLQLLDKRLRAMDDEIGGTQLTEQAAVTSSTGPRLH